MPECDGCTLCCMVLPVPWLDKEPGEWCNECDIGVGCRIYDNQPLGCKEYECAYRQNEKVSINLRPDKCNVIFEKISDDIMLALSHPKHNDSFKQTIIENQIKFFIREGYSIVLSSFSLKGFFIIPKKGKTNEEVLEKVETFIKNWYST